MGILRDIAKITGNTNATIGTDALGNAVTVNTLTGFTMFPVVPQEVPSDYLGVNKLVQTTDATAPVLQVNDSANLFPASDTVYRVKFRAMLRRQDKELGITPRQAIVISVVVGTFTANELVLQPTTNAVGKYIKTIGGNVMHVESVNGVQFVASSGAIVGLTSAATCTSGNLTQAAETWIDLNGNSAASNRMRIRSLIVSPALASPDHSRHAATCAGVCMYNDDPNGAYAGSEISRGHTESGAVYFDAAGTAIAGGVYSANFPTDEWGWLVFCMDITAKRFWWSFNGFNMGFHSFSNMAVLANISKSWAFTFPLFSNMRWELLEVQDWTGTAASADSGAGVDAPVVSQTASCTWRLPTTFASVAVPPMCKFTAPTPTNATFVSMPQSLGSGNRPLAEKGRWTTTSNAGVVCPFATGLMPVVVSPEGWATGMLALRAEGTTWTGSFGFGLFASFVLSYAGGLYKLADYAGTTLGTWATNAQVDVLISFHIASKRVKCTVSDTSKDWTSAATVSGADVVLHPSDAVPASTTTYSLAGSFAATTNNIKLEIEKISMWKEPVVLLTDSYTSSALTGSVDATNGIGATATSIGDVTSFTTAARATLNLSSLRHVAQSNADGNAHGLLTFPYGSEYPKWSYIVFGRTGKKITDWEANNLNPGMNNLMCPHYIILGGKVNDVGGASTSNLADSISTALAATFRRICLHALDRYGRVTLIRTPFPPDLSSGTNAPSPANALAATYAKKCWYDTDDKIDVVVADLQRTRRGGLKIRVLDGGRTDFDIDGVHLGAPGSLPAFEAAMPQYAGAERVTAGTGTAGTIGAYSGYATSAGDRACR